MDEYVGLDVSLNETTISVRRNGKRIWRGACPSHPQAISAVLSQHAPNAARVVLETGPLAVWLFHSLTAEGLPVICIDARHAKAALDMAPNKTDANDADGLAQLSEVGFFREVRVKQYDSMLTRTLVGARSQMIKIVTDLHNQIRGGRCQCKFYTWLFAPRAVHRIIVFTEQFWICTPRFSAKNRLYSFALTVPRRAVKIPEGVFRLGHATPLARTR